MNKSYSIYIINQYISQSISRYLYQYLFGRSFFFSARNQIWTGDTRIFSPLLYQLSYPDLFLCIILVEYLYLCQLKGLKNQLNKVFQILNLKNGGVVLCIVHGLLNNTEKIDWITGIPSRYSNKKEIYSRIRSIEFSSHSFVKE